jgi:hypothetical protein
MDNFAPLLLGKDLRTVKKSNEVAKMVQDQESFDQLFGLLFHHERTLVMRAADAVEKVTIAHEEFLEPHKFQLLSLLKSAVHKELKWHIAQLVPRLSLSPGEFGEAWSILAYWAQNPNESKIVRVNSLQGLFELSRNVPAFKAIFEGILQNLAYESVPSLKARIKKLSRL